MDSCFASSPPYDVQYFTTAPYVMLLHLLVSGSLTHKTSILCTLPVGRLSLRTTESSVFTRSIITCLKLEPLTNVLPLLISHFLTSHTHHSLWIMIFVSSPTYHLRLFFAIDNSIFNNMVLYRLNYSFVHNKNHYIYAHSICHTTASRFHFHDNQHIKLPLPSILHFLAHGYYYNLPLIYTHIHRYSFALFHCLFHNRAHTITNLSLPT
jgi:hypothetical protein